MTDWNKPTTGSNYSTEFIPEVKNRDLSIAKADFSADTNIPDDVIRYNETTDKWERYDLGTLTWTALDFHTPIDAHIANTAIHSPVPTGAVLAYGGASAPSGFLLCDGTAVSRTTYATLFGIVGTTFGAGDGSTTFNVPELRQRFPLGKAASGTGSTLGGSGGTIDHVHTGPSHTHTVAGHTHDMGNHTHTGGAHTHSTSDHTHSVPAHYHDTQGSGATINVTGSGTHSHAIDSRESGVAGTGNQLMEANNLGSASVNTDPSTHTHPHANVVGLVGNVASTINGDVGMTSGAGGAGTTGSGGAVATGVPSTNTTSSTGLTTDTGGTGNTGSANPPYLVLNYIIKT